jgi:hypothetical protein
MGSRRLNGAAPHPLRKALISLAKKGVFRFAKMAGIGGGTRPAISKRLEFPENRENNREFSKFPAISALFAGSGVHLRCNSKALRTILCSARNSEFASRNREFIGRSREL